MTAKRNCSYRRRTLSRLLVSFIWFLLLVLVFVPSRVLAQSAAEASRLNKQAVSLYIAGKFSEAEPLFRRSLAILEKTLGPEHPSVATGLNNLGMLYHNQGKYAEAEPLLRRALAIREKLLGPAHPDVATSLNNLAFLYSAQGHYAQAESLYRRSLEIRERTVGLEDPNLAQSLNNLASVYQAQGRYSEAEPLFRRSLAIREKTLGPEHPNVAASLNSLASLYRAQGRYSEAEPLFMRSLAIWEKTLGPEHPNLAASLNNLATLYQGQRQYDQAEPLFRRSLAIREKALGPEHPDVAQSLNNLANTLALQGKVTIARSFYERARQIYLAVSRVNIDLDDEALRGLLQTGRRSLNQYAKLLADVGRDPKLDRSPGSATRDAFLVVEQARSGLAQAALAKSGARVAGGDPATADLARQVQDLRNRSQNIGKLVTEEWGKPTAQRNTERLENLHKETQRLDSELAGVVSRLNAAFPKYGEIASPEPIDVTAATQMLRPDEGLVSFFTLDDRLLVWLVRKGKESIYRDIKIKKADLAKLASRVRVSLDQSANPNVSVSQLLPFDVGGSHELFKLLFAPIQEHLAGVKHVIIVPDETLLPLPFGALVTKAEGEPYRTLADLYTKKLSPSPAELTDYAKLSWLAKEYAITVLPSGHLCGRYARYLAPNPVT